MKKLILEKVEMFSFLILCFVIVGDAFYLIINNQFPITSIFLKKNISLLKHVGAGMPHSRWNFLLPKKN